MSWSWTRCKPTPAITINSARAPPGAEQFTNSPEYTFHTARPPGSSFTFTLTADAHLDEHTSPDVYRQTLANIRADKPDFHIDLGNLFMTDKHASRDEAARQYLAQRYYLGQIGRSAPIFLALGTHDGESSQYDDGSGDCLAVWSNLMRKRYFPNPVPDNFYTGNNTAQTALRPAAELLRLGMGRCALRGARSLPVFTPAARRR